jgi:aspartyl-tRNA(Asn)/glutamyl-tRNA(Gln) amidotransferase subunit B
MDFEPVIGLEIHVELQTRSKMFCACPVTDSVSAAPNTAVCPVCAGMPGVLPVLNQAAVEYGLRVALALECTVNPVSIFARKNYFYPDLPKGYQISQYEEPLAVNGRLLIQTSQGERMIRIRRVHLEEDTGKLTHVPGADGAPARSLVNLNRAGVPLLEIVSEPDLHTAEEVRLYAQGLRAILRTLGVNSGDLEKGVMRIEPNVSVRPVGMSELGTRTEIKNLNSFRALERSVAYEIQRQSELIRAGGRVIQQTLGWDERAGVTLAQRSKEEAHDYRYFPEPDLPPLVIEPGWVAAIRASQPELPAARTARLQSQYRLSLADAALLAGEQAAADYFEQAAAALTQATPRQAANWIIGDLYGLLNAAGVGIETCPIPPAGLAGLADLAAAGEINQTTAKAVLAEMFGGGKSALEIVEAKGLRQVSDAAFVAGLVEKVLSDNPDQVASYRAGKESVARWLFGQVMRLGGGKANPQVVQEELERKLQE